MKKQTNRKSDTTSKSNSGRDAAERRRKNRKLNPFATRLSAHVTEEGEWITEPPNLTLSRMFLVVLLLHIVIVGGILAFEMFKEDPVEPPASASVTPMTRDHDTLGATGNGNGAAAQRYRVQAGDTLSQIARRFRVTGVELKAVNRLGNGDDIFSGQVLLIPPNRLDTGNERIPTPVLSGRDEGLAEVVPASLAGDTTSNAKLFAPREEVSPPVLRELARGEVQSPSAISVPPVATGRTHKVEIGETAFAISRRYGVTVDALLAANGINDARFLRAGDVIQIP